jgi:hypothetical protein
MVAEAFDVFGWEHTPERWTKRSMKQQRRNKAEPLGRIVENRRPISRESRRSMVAWARFTWEKWAGKAHLLASGDGVET